MRLIAKISKITIFVSIFLIALVLFLTQDDTTNEQKAEAQENEPKKVTEEDILSRARYACMATIEENLNDPDSAEWGIWSDNPYQTWPASVDGDIVTVEPKFRAKNGFGGTVLTSFICKIDTSADWELLELQQL